MEESYSPVDKMSSFLGFCAAFAAVYQWKRFRTLTMIERACKSGVSNIKPKAWNKGQFDPQEDFKKYKKNSNFSASVKVYHSHF